MEWISVKERLPEKGTRALTVRFDYVTNTQFIDILTYDGEWWNSAYRGDYAVSHWMPLPKLPTTIIDK